MFKKGDVVIAKEEWLDKGETRMDTVGIVVDYDERNDLLLVGSMHPEKWVLPPILNARGECYELFN